MDNGKGKITRNEKNPNSTDSTARRGAVKAGAKKKQAEFSGFVNVKVEERDKDSFQEWVTVSGAFDTAFLEASEQGFKFSVNYDEREDCFRASAACWVSGLPGAGRILTLRASHPTAALMRCVWVLTQKLAYDLGEGEVEKPDPDRW